LQPIARIYNDDIFFFSWLKVTEIARTCAGLNLDILQALDVAYFGPFNADSPRGIGIETQSAALFLTERSISSGSSFIGRSRQFSRSFAAAMISNQCQLGEYRLLGKFGRRDEEQYTTVLTRSQTHRPV